MSDVTCEAQCDVARDVALDVVAFADVTLDRLLLAREAAVERLAIED